MKTGGAANNVERPTAFAKAPASLAVARLSRAQAEGREVQVVGDAAPHDN